MKKILYIGEYLPIFSCNTMFTQHVVSEMVSAKHEVTLLSKSWCTVTENSFCGYRHELFEDTPFKKKYFVDPIQLKVSRSGLFAGLLGLGQKIIETEHIEHVVFADDIEYLPLIELFKRKYGVECSWLFFDPKYEKDCFDDYLFLIYRDAIKHFDNIYTYPQYSEMIRYTFRDSIKSVLICSPFNLQHNTLVSTKNEEIVDSIFLICTGRSEYEVEKSVRYSLSSFDEIMPKLTVCFPYSDSKFVRLLHNIIGPNINVGMFDLIPPNSCVIWDSYIQLPNPHLNSIILSIKNGWIPLITKRNLPYISDFVLEKQSVGTEYFGIKRMYISDKSVSQLLASN